MKKKEKLVALLKGLAARIPRRMMQVRSSFMLMQPLQHVEDTVGALQLVMLCSSMADFWLGVECACHDARPTLSFAKAGTRC